MATKVYGYRVKGRDYVSFCSANLKNLQEIMHVQFEGLKSLGRAYFGELSKEEWIHNFYELVELTFEEE